MAEGKVAYVGQPIAVVIADTPEIAQDAAEQIELDIAELPAVYDIAGAAEAEQIWNDIPENRSFRWDRRKP